MWIVPPLRYLVSSNEQGCTWESPGRDKKMGRGCLVYAPVIFTRTSHVTAMRNPHVENNDGAVIDRSQDCQFAHEPLVMLEIVGEYWLSCSASAPVINPSSGLRLTSHATRSMFAALKGAGTWDMSPRVPYIDSWTY